MDHYYSESEHIIIVNAVVTITCGAFVVVWFDHFY